MSQVETNTLILAVLATALIVYISCSNACQQRNGGFSDMMNGGMIMLGLKKRIDPLVGEGVQRPAGPIRSLINQGAAGAIENTGPMRSLVTNKSTGAAPEHKEKEVQIKGQPVRSELQAGAPHNTIDHRPEYGSKTIGGAATSTLKNLVNQVTAPRAVAPAAPAAPAAHSVPAASDVTDNRGVGSLQATPLLKKRGGNLIHKASNVIKRVGVSSFPFQPETELKDQSGMMTGPAGPAGPAGPPRPEGPPPKGPARKGSQGTQLSKAFVGAGQFHTPPPGEQNAVINRPEPETSINKNASYDIRPRPPPPQSNTSGDMLNVSSVTAADLA